MKAAFSFLLVLAWFVGGCDLFIEEYVPPTCEGGNLDEFTNLCWQDPKADGVYTWEEATQYCETLDNGGHDDWRLPTIEEFFNILDDCGSYVIGEDEVSCNACEDESLCIALFGSNPGLYWSSTVEQLGTCIIDLTGGYMNYEDNSQLANVRCIRP